LVSPTQRDGVAVKLSINRQEHLLYEDADAPLLDILHNRLLLKGTKLGCGADQCGACTVLVDGFAIAACATPLWAVAGKAVTTIEGLGTPDEPHPLQTAFLAEQAAQCGYCTAGILMRAAALLAKQPHPTETEVREALDRNLCRCGSHNRVVRAVLRAADGCAGANDKAAAQ
jgi:nicotinate dehydrogenase subunit A